MSIGLNSSILHANSNHQLLYVVYEQKLTFDLRFQASAAIWMESALFLDITQRQVVILYRRFGTTHRSHLQGSRNPRRKAFFLRLLDPWKWNRYVVSKRRYITTTRRCVISQKSADLIDLLQPFQGQTSEPARKSTDHKVHLLIFGSVCMGAKLGLTKEEEAEGFGK